MTGLGAIAVCACLVLGGCSQRSPEAGAREGGYGSVQEIVDRLDAAGIVCSSLNVRDGDEIAAEREARPEPSLPPGGVAIAGPEYALVEAGSCVVEGGPEIAGQAVATTITVFEDDDHLESIPEQGFPGGTLVYGDNWEVNLVDAGLAEEAAEALDGRVVPPFEIPEGEMDPVDTASECFFTAALPPGLKAAAAELGEAADEPREYARLKADAAYYLPEETRRELERRCLRGFEQERNVRTGAAALAGRGFRAFWRDACAYGGSDLAIREELGYGGDFSFDGVAKELTRRVLGSSGLSERELSDLRRACERGVREGLIGP